MGSRSGGPKAGKGQDVERMQSQFFCHFPANDGWWVEPTYPSQMFPPSQVQLIFQYSLAPSYRLSVSQCSKLQTYLETCADSPSTMLHHTGHCTLHPTTPGYVVYTKPTPGLEPKSSPARVPLSYGDQTVRMFTIR